MIICRKTHLQESYSKNGDKKFGMLNGGGGGRGVVGILQNPPVLVACLGWLTCRFFQDAVRFQGLVAILNWLTTQIDFMREL